MSSDRSDSEEREAQSYGGEEEEVASTSQSSTEGPRPIADARRRKAILTGPSTIPESFTHLVPASQKKTKAAPKAKATSDQPRSKKTALVTDPASGKIIASLNTPEAMGEGNLLNALHLHSDEEWKLLCAERDFDAALRKRYHISADYQFHKVVDHKTPKLFLCGRSKNDVLYLHFDNFMAGFRPPFDPFLIEMMNLMEALPSDFHPNATRTMTAFIAACRFQKFEPTLAQFKYFYDLVGADVQGQISVRVRTKVPRAFFPNHHKVRDYSLRIMRVQSKVGWPFPRFPARTTYKLPSTWPRNTNIGEPNPHHELAFRRVVGASEGIDIVRMISVRALTDVRLGSSSLAGISGGREGAILPSMVSLPAPTVLTSDPDWVAMCHIGRCFPTQCESCKGEHRPVAMVIASQKRAELRAAAERAKVARSAELKDKDEVTLPTVHVGMNRGLVQAGSSSGAIAAVPVSSAAPSGTQPLMVILPATDSKKKTAKPTAVVGTEKRKDAPPRQGEGHVPKKSKTVAGSSEADTQIAEVENAKRASREAARKQKAVVTDLDGEPIIDLEEEERVEPMERLDTSVPLHLNPLFLQRSTEPDWGVRIKESISAVPPLTNLAKNWPRHARIAIGEALVNRISAPPSITEGVSAAAVAEVAIAEFGLAAHAIANCLVNNLAVAQRVDAEADQAKKALAEANTNFSRSTADMAATWETTEKDLRDQIERAQKLNLDREKEFEKTLSESEQKLEATEAKLKSEMEARKKLDKDLGLAASAFKVLEWEKAAVDTDLKTAQGTIAKLQEALSEADTARETAEAALATAVNAATEAATEAALDSTRYWDDIFESYDQGIYHMARCHRRAYDRNQVPSLEDLASFTQEESSNAELLQYHSTIPFTQKEIEEMNASAAKKNEPPPVLPPLVFPNMRSIQVRMDPTLANRIEEASVVVEEVATPIPEASAVGDEDQSAQK